jgi:hypothetical protein
MIGRSPDSLLISTRSIVLFYRVRHAQLAYVAGSRFYAGAVLDLTALDLDEIATALSEHQTTRSGGSRATSSSTPRSFEAARPTA